MALQIVPISFSWRDAKGWVGRTRFHITGDDSAPTFVADMATVITNLQAAVGGLTNAAFQGSNGFYLFTSPSLVYGDNLQYPAEWMKAVFQFSTSINTVISRFKIPAPEIDLFEADGVTIKNDGTQAQVVAFVNAVKDTSTSAHVSTASGDAYTHFEGGLLRLGRQPRRFNERVKSATLVAGEGE